MRNYHCRTTSLKCKRNVIGVPCKTTVSESVHTTHTRITLPPSHTLNISTGQHEVLRSGVRSSQFFFFSFFGPCGPLRLNISCAHERCLIQRGAGGGSLCAGCVWREGVGCGSMSAHPLALGLAGNAGECRGAPARVRAWRCEGCPPLPHHFRLCVCGGL